MLQGYANKVEKKRFQSLAMPKLALSADGAKIAASRRICTQKLQRTPQVNSEWITSRVTLPTDAYSSDAALESSSVLFTLLNHVLGCEQKKGAATR